MQTHIKMIGRDLKKTSTLSLSQCYDEAVKSLGLAQSYQQYLQKPEIVNPIFLMQIFTRPERELFRYQFDGTWRNIRADEPYTNGDYFTAKVKEFSLVKYNIMKSDVMLNGLLRSFTQSTGLIHIGEGRINLESKVIYCAPPTTLPSYDEMVSQFANTTDEGVNVLLLDVDGRYSIKNFHEIDITNLDHIVYRGESWSARGYVGLKASKDNAYMLNEYKDTIASWCDFIQDGSTDNYVDSNSNAGLAELDSLYTKFSKSITRRF